LIEIFQGSRELEAMFERLNERVAARSSPTSTKNLKKGE